jgi:hypothetical protein
MTRALIGLGVLGGVGSLAITLMGPRLVDRPGSTWWFASPTASHALANTLFYGGIALLVIAWLLLGALIRKHLMVSATAVLICACVWCAPLLVAPALFSRDMYSYFAQGTLLHLNYNPYLHAPSALSSLGASRVLAAVDPFWRHTTSPYGPLFVGICALVAAVCGSHLVAAIIVLRLVEVAGLGLCAYGVVRLARILGADVRAALWLSVASPLALLELVAAGHSDALMIGLMVLGLALAMSESTIVGPALIALAAMVKLPALVVLAFVLFVLPRRHRDPAQRVRMTGSGALVALGIIGAVSIGTGVNLSWISRATLAAPGKVLLAITPSSALAWTIQAIAHGLPASAGARPIASTLSNVLLAILAAGALVALVRTRPGALVPVAAAVLCVAALAGPAAWPWYFTWGLVLLAAWPAAQWSPVAIGAICVSAFYIQPDGTLTIPIGGAPVLLGCYLLLGVGAAYRWSRARRAVATS